MTKVEVLTLEEQVKNHLEYNLTVPPPQSYIPELVKIGVEAINAVNNGEFDKEIQLSDRLVLVLQDGTQIHTAYAYEIVREYKLTQWLNEEWF